MPTALCGPGFDGGGRVDELVSIVDLAPTLLDAAGLPVPDEMQGRPVLPLLQGGRRDWPEEAFVQVSEAQLGRAVRTRRWKYGVVAPDKDGRKEPASETYAEEYLYDLRADPYQLNNLAGLESHREVSRVMGERLVRRMVEIGEVEPTIEQAPERSGGQLRVSSDEARA